MVWETTERGGFVRIEQEQFVEKPRVRERSSDKAVGLKNSALFANTGVKGTKFPCGVWGSAPQKTSELMRISQRVLGAYP